MTAATLRLAIGTKPWTQRVGYFCFAFFLFKGLMWLGGGVVLFLLL